jgi:enoyl-CoA hydratase/carnithine racemase
MNQELLVERRGPAAWLTINRPEVRNALGLAITKEIVDTLRKLSADKTVRVIVLTGAGNRVFVSGADVREFKEHLATPETALKYDAAAEELQSALRAVPQPVIARINGHAVGSGTIVAVSCDFRITVRQAKFGIPVAKFGFIAPVPDTLRLIQLIGPANTKMMMMTAQLIEADRAKEIGLVDQVVDAADVDAAVDELTNTLAMNAPLTLKATKQMIEQLNAPSSDVMAGTKWYQEIFRSRDFQEGLNAFLTKRKPEFTGE